MPKAIGAFLVTRRNIAGTLDSWHQGGAAIVPCVPIVQCMLRLYLSSLCQTASSIISASTCPFLSHFLPDVLYTSWSLSIWLTAHVCKRTGHVITYSGYLCQGRNSQEHAESNVANINDIWSLDMSSSRVKTLQTWLEAVNGQVGLSVPKSSLRTPEGRILGPDLDQSGLDLRHVLQVSCLCMCPQSCMASCTSKAQVRLVWTSLRTHTEDRSPACNRASFGVLLGCQIWPIGTIACK